MRSNRTVRHRSERLIAAARIALALVSLLAVWLDPAEPANSAAVAYALLVAYVLYALTLALVAWRRRVLSPQWPFVTHAVDLVFFSLFLFFTIGPGSPFNVYFVFALICGTLRWQLKGTIVTAGVILAVFIAFGAYFAWVATLDTFNLRAFTIRGVYLVGLAVMLGYVGLHEQRVLREMWLLTAWPRDEHSDLERLTRELLQYFERLFATPSVVLVWEEADSQVVRCATSQRDGSWAYERLPGGTGLAHPELRDRAFICEHRDAGPAMIQVEPRTLALSAWQGDAVPRALVPKVAARAFLSVPVVGARTVGRLFLLDKRDMALDDVMMAEIMASVVAARLDAYYLHQQMLQVAASDERIRLARDLHDGTLQSFTGIGLRLAAIRELVEQHDPSALGEVTELQSVIADEQRELRFFIQDLKPAVMPNRQEELSTRLAELITRVERVWDVTVTLKIDLPTGLADTLSRDIYHIVREALVNAARHGHATTATVRVTADADAGIVLRIEDDGSGFPFTGAYPGDELGRLGIGPKALCERVQSLNGTLMLDTSADGASLEILLPCLAA